MASPRLDMRSRLAVTIGSGRGHEKVSRGSLGSTQSGVRIPQQSSKLGFSRQFRRSPNANGALCSPVLLSENAGFKRHAETFGDPCGLVEVHARQKDHKLVPALSTDDCGTIPDQLLDHLRDIPEGHIAGVMAVLVIEGLERIDVTHQRGDRLAQVTRVVKGLSGDRVEPSAVQQSGQRVHRGQIEEFFVRRSQVLHETAHTERNEGANQCRRDRPNRQTNLPKLGSGKSASGREAHEQTHDYGGQKRRSSDGCEGLDRDPAN